MPSGHVKHVRFACSAALFPLSVYFFSPFLPLSLPLAFSPLLRSQPSPLLRLNAWIQSLKQEHSTTNTAEWVKVFSPLLICFSYLVCPLTSGALTPSYAAWIWNRTWVAHVGALVYRAHVRLWRRARGHWGTGAQRCRSQGAGMSWGRVPCWQRCGRRRGCRRWASWWSCVPHSSCCTCSVSSASPRVSEGRGFGIRAVFT